MFREKTDLSECCRNEGSKKKKKEFYCDIYEFDYFLHLIFKKAIF